MYEGEGVGVRMVGDEVWVWECKDRREDEGVWMIDIEGCGCVQGCVCS